MNVQTGAAAQAGAVFTIRVVDMSPQTIGSIGPLNVTVGNSLFY